MYGHQKQIAKLHRLLDSGLLAHALLFVGPNSVGKRLLARELAKKILCFDQNESTAFDAGTHPDYYFLDGAEKTTVEDIRTLLSNLSLTPLMGKARVAIIDHADDLSLAVQNTLLKTLEEPRPRSFFFLITSNPTRIANTVRSRCQNWFFNELPILDLQSALSALGKQFPVDALQRLSEKTIETALHSQLQTETSNANQLSFLKCLRGDSSGALLFASEIAQDKENVGVTLRQLIGITRHHLQNSVEASEQYRLSLFLANLVNAVELIENRNLAVLPVLSMLLLELAKPFSPRQRKVAFGPSEIILS